MESEFNPDQLKPFDKVHEADPRHDAFSRFDQNISAFRPVLLGVAGRPSNYRFRDVPWLRDVL